jgi:hypothetical protein
MLRILGNQIEIESIEIEFPLITDHDAVTSFPPFPDVPGGPPPSSVTPRMSGGAAFLANASTIG